MLAYKLIQTCRMMAEGEGFLLAADSQHLAVQRPVILRQRTMIWPNRTLGGGKHSSKHIFADLISLQANIAEILGGQCHVQQPSAWSG